ncbi:hypothetical protein KEM60_00394 [Austwickia sp. TVS 96-490-7B]|uniref:ArsR/SmtB family transcription factor n=1 Tax=Austwickia sp. TVS 96-490-7B TaxID=2830843 RepID=UPI001C5A51A3|nr:metalloregulator ArsR/SmtB family transcription factor [Austwickia sp. TVS 96-490-7B]MBW3084208.1 hypothetical protein [Austwickia sp. TVS 96-490-7B]
MVERQQPRSHWVATGDLFKCLSAPLRIGIIELLVTKPHTVTALVDALGVPQPLVSQHLRVLRQHCLVEAERNGREMHYRLMDEHIAHIVRDAVAHTAEHNHPAVPDHREITGEDQP